MRYQHSHPDSVSMPAIVLISCLLASGALGATRFAILGDRTGGAEPGIHEKIVQEVQRLRPDFVVTVGDMIEGPAPDTTELSRRWEEYHDITSVLSMPLYPVPGNNDIWDDVSEQWYRRYAGEPYYSFSEHGIHFIVLDNSRWESSNGFPEEQLIWMEKDLGERKYEKIVVLFHKPFWFERVADGKDDPLHDIFVSNGVDAVFTGHYHRYFSGTFDGIRYTNVGSSGGYSRPGPTGLNYHYVWVTVDGNDWSIAPIKLGSVLGWDEMTVDGSKSIASMTFSGLEFPVPAPLSSDLAVESSDVVLLINNLTTEIMVDTLDWDIPEGWTVQPRHIPVHLQPGQSIGIPHTVRSGTALYPLPTITFSFSYAPDRVYDSPYELQLQRTAKCVRASSPPIIDGSLNETFWTHPETRYFASDGSMAVTDSFAAYFAYDRDYLYLAAACRDTDIESITVTATDQDGPVYADDCVGYFFQPDPVRYHVFQLYFNSRGIAFDQEIELESDGDIITDREWEWTGDVMTKVDKKEWTLEARLPLSQFGIESISGSQWGINFRRKQPRLNAIADWQIPISYDPRTYGLLKFAD